MHQSQKGLAKGGAQKGAWLRIDMRIYWKHIDMYSEINGQLNLIGGFATDWPFVELTFAYFSKGCLNQAKRMDSSCIGRGGSLNIIFLLLTNQVSLTRLVLIYRKLWIDGPNIGVSCQFYSKRKNMEN